LALIGVALLASSPVCLGGQNTDSQSQSDIRDLAAKKTALLKDSSDLTAMAESLQGAEQETALRINDGTILAVAELDATIGFYSVYEKMQCEADRAIAKAALKNRLGLYSHVLNFEADHLTHYLPMTKLPAVAQAGLQLRDDLRAAKSKLDAIAASLE
jgi:hypothetical protein